MHVNEFHLRVRANSGSALNVWEKWNLLSTLAAVESPGRTLRIFSSAKSAKSLPTFYEKEKLNGSVELNIKPGDSISISGVNVHVSIPARSWYIVSHHSL